MSETRLIVDGVAGFILPPDKCCETCDHFKDSSYGVAQYQLVYLREQVVILRRNAATSLKEHMVLKPTDYQGRIYWVGRMKGLQDVINLLGVKGKEISRGRFIDA